MNSQVGGIDWTIIAVYLLAVVGLGVAAGFLRHKGERGGEGGHYFLAGNTLAWPVIGLAMFAANISTVHLVSLAAATEVRPQLVLERAQAAPDYTDWILGYPTIPPALRDPEDNFDEDDLNNAEEYLFLRNPALADGAGVWTFARAARGWVLEFPQRTGLPPDVNYVIETGEALVGSQWQPAAGIEFSVLFDMGGALRMRAFIPEEPLTAQRFYRFRLQVGMAL